MENLVVVPEGGQQGICEVCELAVIRHVVEGETVTVLVDTMTYHGGKLVGRYCERVDCGAKLVALGEPEGDADGTKEG